ncbi:hypothetical protein EBZ39_10440 [bacterium]|nr:hypothetical protein [bacterium]
MTIERILKISVPKYSIRLWLSVPQSYEHRYEGIQEIEVYAHQHQDLPLVDLALLLLDQHGVIAVECLDWANNGVVVRK